jgi:hypothetical protein
MVVTPSRSATAIREASVPPIRRSAYWRDELRRPPQVGVGKVHWPEAAGGIATDRVEELRLGRGTAEPIDQVARLREDGHRQGELLGRFL